LANPVALQVSSFATPAPRGFGLMQRHRKFAQFEDIEARYERRPSLWIEPAGDWGEGHVELVEIPTREEIHDNIVAYWRPNISMVAGKSYAYSYRMRWGDGPAEARPPHGRVVATRAGGAADGEMRLFAIDYAADLIPPDLEPKVTTSAGSIVETHAAIVEATGNYRIFFKFDPAGTRLAELRLTLESNDKRWGETWLYRWTR
jgi:glucans biosynthesis protein